MSTIWAMSNGDGTFDAYYGNYNVNSNANYASGVKNDETKQEEQLLFFDDISKDYLNQLAQDTGAELQIDGFEEEENATGTNYQTETTAQENSQNTYAQNSYMSEPKNTTLDYKSLNGLQVNPEDYQGNYKTDSVYSDGYGWVC